VTTILYNNYNGVLNFPFLLFISMVLCRQADLQKLWGPMFSGCRPKNVTEQPSSWS